MPGRCEPGTGEINYPAIAQALREVGYTGVVGLGAWASADGHTAWSGSAGVHGAGPAPVSTAGAVRR